MWGATYPASETEEDVAAAERQFRFHSLWFLDPAVRGEYPDCYVGGMTPERLGVEPGDMEIIKTDFDCIGINLYSRTVVANDPNDRNLGTRGVNLPDVERTDYNWEVYPEALHDVIMRIWNDYKLPIYVTENGASYGDAPDASGGVNDERRISFLQRYIAGVARAIEEGADVRGYYHWTLTDNFEWAMGFSQRFGLVYNDFETQTRTIKNSGYWYRDLIANSGYEY
jgi:beta-glucosidase